MKHPSRGYRSGGSRRSFLKGAGALGLTLATARRARGTSGFDFRSNFNACPLGPFTTASKNLAWSDPAITSMWDPDKGAVYSIVQGGRFGGQCCRTFYPAGQVGQGNRIYRLNLGSPGLPLNVEFDFMFEVGADIYEGGGKVCPAIEWGTKGTIHMVWWDSAGSAKTTPKYEFIGQVQRPGYVPHELLTSVLSPNVITPGQWNHFHFQVIGRPNGWANYWMDGALITTVPMPAFTLASDPVAINFATFAGGGLPYAPLVDSWARHDNVRIWIGL